MSVPLQHESCNRTFLSSPSQQPPQETHTSCLWAPPNPPAVRRRTEVVCVICAWSMQISNVNKKCLHQSVSLQSGTISYELQGNNCECWLLCIIFHTISYSIIFQLLDLWESKVIEFSRESRKQENGKVRSSSETDSPLLRLCLYLICWAHLLNIHNLQVLSSVQLLKSLLRIYSKQY